MVYYCATNMSLFEATESTNKSAGAFVSMTVVLFVLTLSAADSIGFVPYYVDGTAPATVALDDLPELGEEPVIEPVVNPVAPVRAVPERVVAETAPVNPERIIIDGIDLDLRVQNPVTKDIAALDVLLQKGPARYVDSAQLSEKGNILIFAHTSHLPVVHNQMYKAFNRLPELEKGDVVTLQGGGKEYIYTVRSVRRADAEEEIIDLSPSLGHMLTLVTCDTLTSKTSRWIVEAELVGSY